MPQDAPGRLSDAEYTDVVAFMLEANSYPAGEVELPADKAALDEIMNPFHSWSLTRRVWSPRPSVSICETSPRLAGDA